MLQFRVKYLDEIVGLGKGTQNESALEYIRDPTRV